MLWNVMIFCLCFIGAVDSRAAGGNTVQTNNLLYRAKRYGSYYKNVYYSYSGGVGHARYSRVYKTAPNLYPRLYHSMFDWLATPSFKVYKATPFGSISVCKNYEADDNGTYLGIFTCPLPFVPTDHAYCCGVTNAQYCCTFWDVPQNYAAAMLVMLMGAVLAVSAIGVLVILIYNTYTKAQEKRREYGLTESTWKFEITESNSSETQSSDFQSTSCFWELDSTQDDYATSYYHNSCSFDGVLAEPRTNLAKDMVINDIKQFVRRKGSTANDDNGKNSTEGQWLSVALVNGVKRDLDVIGRQNVTVRTCQERDTMDEASFDLKTDLFTSTFCNKSSKMVANGTPMNGRNIEPEPGYFKNNAEATRIIHHEVDKRHVSKNLYVEGTFNSCACADKTYDNGCVCSYKTNSAKDGRIDIGSPYNNIRVRHLKETSKVKFNCKRSKYHT